VILKRYLSGHVYFSCDHYFPSLSLSVVVSASPLFCLLFLLHSILSLSLSLSRSLSLSTCIPLFFSPHSTPHSFYCTTPGHHSQASSAEVWGERMEVPHTE